MREIYIGGAERLARILENPGYDISATSLSYGSTASILAMEKNIDIKDIVDGIVGHSGNGMSLGNYVLYCLSRFWTNHEKNYDTVPAVSPPFRSSIFLSFLNIPAFSIFDSLILRSSSGLPL